jgi:hypothetical protein
MRIDAQVEEQGLNFKPVTQDWLTCKEGTPQKKKSCFRKSVSYIFLIKPLKNDNFLWHH